MTVEKPDLRPKRADLKLERADLGPGADIRPERTGFRSERPKEGTNEQKDG